LSARRTERFARQAGFAAASFLFAVGIYFFSLALSRSDVVKPRSIYYVPSIHYLRLASGTFRPFLADLICIKGVLELTDAIPDRQVYLRQVFRTAIELDPKLLGAYFLGGMVLPSSRTEIADAIGFLEAVAPLNNRSWGIPYWIGFNYYQLGQYEKAAQYYQRAAALPGAPRYLVTNQAMLYYKADKPQGALLYLEGMLGTIKDDRALELIQLKVDWLKNIVSLDALVDEFRRRFGSWPETIETLAEKGLIDRIPEDTFGNGFYLDKNVNDGSVRVRSRF